jgi:chromate transporter
MAGIAAIWPDSARAPLPRHRAPPRLGRHAHRSSTKDPSLRLWHMLPRHADLVPAHALGPAESRAPVHAAGGAFGRLRAQPRRRPGSATLTTPAPKGVSFGEALRFWLKLGFIGFGGPAGQIAIMHSELVERRRWISEQRFLHALNYCMLLPGPEAQQLATYIGWLLHRTWGGIVAGTLFVLPSLFILIGLSWVYLRFGDAPLVAGVFYGIKPAVTALVLHAAWRIGTRALKNRWMWGIAAAAFVAIFAFEAPFPAIVLAAALAGHFGARHAPQVFSLGGGHGGAGAGAVHAPALIDDQTPPPPHARFSRRRLVAVVAAGLGLWLLAMGALLAAQGWQGTLTQMGWFFTKAALLTFGGAYAVLPYVYQGAVEHHQWLSAAQMIDGLALGETTPGPLIMVVAFVGFVGGWARQVLGPEALFLGGALAATVVTFFTFLPSFVFILAGGPLVEATHGRLGFTAPLSAITAAVVGVILNLALFFAYHVLWPQGFDGRFDWASASIGLAAALALFRFKVGVLPLLAACAAAGLLLRLALA